MIAFLYVRDARSFAAAHVLCGTISGIWLTATAPLGPALLPKLKYATFASVVGVAGSVAALVTAPIVGAWLDHLNHGKAATARDYHPIFLWASLFIFGSMIVTLVVHRYFMAYGGPRGYVPPEPDDAAAGHAFAVVAGGAARPPGDR